MDTATVPKGADVSVETQPPGRCDGPHQPDPPPNRSVPPSAPSSHTRPSTYVRCVSTTVMRCAINPPNIVQETGSLKIIINQGGIFSFPVLTVFFLLLFLKRLGEFHLVVKMLLLGGGGEGRGRLTQEGRPPCAPLTGDDAFASVLDTCDALRLSHQCRGRRRNNIYNPMSPSFPTTARPHLFRTRIFWYVPSPLCLSLFPACVQLPPPGKQTPAPPRATQWWSLFTSECMYPRNSRGHLQNRYGGGAVCVWGGGWIRLYHCKFK